MDPDVRRGIRKRQEWIRRNPGSAGDYIRLTKADRGRVDNLFLGSRKLKANEVSSLVERLTGQRLAGKRKGAKAQQALANMRARLGHLPSYKDKTVVGNTGKMAMSDVKVATVSTTEELQALARPQHEGNLFFYH